MISRDCVQNAQQINIQDIHRTCDAPKSQIKQKVAEDMIRHLISPNLNDKQHKISLIILFTIKEKYLNTSLKNQDEF